MSDGQIEPGAPRTRLRPVVASDLEFLRSLELGGENGIRYRHRGVAASPEEFNARLWAGVLHQVVAIEPDTGLRLGLIACFGVDWRNGHGHLAFVFSDEARSRGEAADAVARFIDYAFTVFPLRKLYGEVLEFNLGTFRSSIGRCAEVEGRKRLHDWHDGRYWDQLILAVYREAWHEYRKGAGARSLSEGRRAVEELWADLSPSDDDLVSQLPLDSLARLELTDLVEAVTGTGTGLDAEGTFDTMTVGYLRALLDAQA